MTRRKAVYSTTSALADAQRFVRRWENRRIKAGSAWRDKSGELRWYQPHGFTQGVSVPQSCFMPRREAVAA